MRDTFNDMVAILDRAMPQIFNLPWQQYGVFVLEVEGRPKYKGFKLELEWGANGQYHYFGQLPDRVKTSATLAAKFGLVRDHGLPASIDGRDPPSLWGGAVGFSLIRGGTDRGCLGGSGLPELADHISGVQLLDAMGFPRPEDRSWEELLDPDRPSIAAAREFVDMSVDQFVLLKAAIGGSIYPAHARYPR